VKGSRGWVDLGGRADNPDRSQPLPVGNQERDRREAGFHIEDTNGSGREAIGRPSLDVMPEGVQAIGSAHARCEQVCAVE